MISGATTDNENIGVHEDYKESTKIKCRENGEIISNKEPKKLEEEV